jgi:DNA-binding transcriptional ArsR family regulator
LRIRLIVRLSAGAATVTELVEAVDGVQQNVSQHLAILHQAGILRRRKQGTRVRYELVDEHVVSIIQDARESLTRHSDELSSLIERSE